MRVLERVDRIIVEATGQLRTVHDTVILEGSVCDRYLGCARGMPFLWRESWLRRVAGPVGAGDPQPPADSGGSARGQVHRWSLAAKRGMDIVGATAACVLLAPVLAWTALLVAATQGLPILFRHERPGLHGKPFTIYKFRTMRPPKRGEVWYLTDDERISRLGRFLRASSLDELPELWNVLRGDMSLVGPRPLLSEYLPTYTPEERRRHDMRPGITGWAAVNGRHALRFEDRLKLDVWYVDHWSLWLDLRIIARTAGHVLRRTHVSTTQDLEAVGFPLPGVGGAPLASPERSDGQGTVGLPTAEEASDDADAADRPDREPVGAGG
jgi:lipopolysaccharide/colanic/teichoic acid biosynthesis glycosyltransferase